MREDRPFPPSARRRGLAIRAGIHAASPIVVGAAACAAVVLALVLTGRALADRLGTALAAACNGAGLGADQLVTAVIATALPILGAAAIVAVIAHLAQTRALWLPRRRVEGAPALERGAVRQASFELLAATIVGVVAFAWLWWVAPRLARLSTVDDLAGSGGQVLASAVAAVAIAWVAIGACDAVLRHVELARALRMTAREKREDDRLGSADPRWRRLRTRLSREPTIRAAVAGASVLILGDDIAVAIAWHPHRRPIPLRTAAGRGALATQLLGLARRHHIPVHRDPRLAALVFGDAPAPVPEIHWPQLAEVIAALRV